METIIIGSLSILVLVACLVGLFLIVHAYWNDIVEIIGIRVYFCWLRCKRFFSRKQLVSGDIISLEDMIERANPASLSDKEHILTMMREVWNEGFNSQEEMIRYDACKDAFLAKFGR